MGKRGAQRGRSQRLPCELGRESEGGEERWPILRRTTRRRTLRICGSCGNDKAASGQQGPVLVFDLSLGLRQAKSKRNWLPMIRHEEHAILDLFARGVVRPWKFSAPDAGNG